MAGTSLCSRTTCRWRLETGGHRHRSGIGKTTLRQPSWTYPPHWPGQYDDRQRYFAQNAQRTAPSISEMYASAAKRPPRTRFSPALSRAGLCNSAATRVTDGSPCQAVRPNAWPWRGCSSTMALQPILQLTICSSLDEPSEYPRRRDLRGSRERPRATTGGAASHHPRPSRHGTMRPWKWANFTANSQVDRQRRTSPGHDPMQWRPSAQMRQPGTTQSLLNCDTDPVTFGYERPYDPSLQIPFACLTTAASSQ